MKLYDAHGIWYAEQEDGRLFVGISAEADSAMGGIIYVEFSDGHLVVESSKKVYEEDLQAEGAAQNVSEAYDPGLWDEDKAIVVYEPGYRLDKSGLSDTRPCLDNN